MDKRHLHIHRACQAYMEKHPTAMNTPWSHSPIKETGLVEKQLVAGQPQETSLKHLLVSEEGSANTHTHTHTLSLMEASQRDTTWELREVDPSI